jgi:hypothetical protein
MTARGRSIALSVAALAGLAATARGQTFTVTSAADSGNGTLRAAIAQANAYGGAATINLTAGLGTIDLATMLPVLENPYGITINGNGNTIDGGSTSATTDDRVFFIGVSSDIAAVSPGLTATTNTQWAISNLTIQNANARGGNGGPAAAAAGPAWAAASSSTPAT